MVPSRSLAVRRPWLWRNRVHDCISASTLGSRENAGGVFVAVRAISDTIRVRARHAMAEQQRSAHAPEKGCVGCCLPAWIDGEPSPYPAETSKTRVPQLLRRSGV